MSTRPTLGIHRLVDLSPEHERIHLAVMHGRCLTCGAPRTTEMRETEPGQFHLDMVCLDNQEHAC